MGLAEVELGKYFQKSHDVSHLQMGRILHVLGQFDDENVQFAVTHGKDGSRRIWLNEYSFRVLLRKLKESSTEVT
jgi:hypothetical protein